MNRYTCFLSMGSRAEHFLSDLEPALGKAFVSAARDNIVLFVRYLLYNHYLLYKLCLDSAKLRL